jgi:hypothetical protein
MRRRIVPWLIALAVAGCASPPPPRYAYPDPHKAVRTRTVHRSAVQQDAAQPRKDSGATIDMGGGPRAAAEPPRVEWINPDPTP